MACLCGFMLGKHPALNVYLKDDIKKVNKVKQIHLKKYSRPSFCGVHPTLSSSLEWRL